MTIKLKLKAICLAIMFLFAFMTIEGAAIRGMKVIAKTPSGKSVPLYQGSYALVVGNASYNNGWDPLPGAENDGREVARTLKKLGFTVSLKLNLTRQGFDRAFGEFVLSHGKDQNNQLLFYYAGHGYTVPLANGEELGYLVMVDAPAPEKDQLGFKIASVDMQSIVTQAKVIQSKHVLFMFDSCFSGSILSLRDRVVPQIISENVTLPVRQFITAGRANEPVPDYSVFKQAFLDLLEGRAAEPIPDGYVTGEELGLYLKSKVPEYNSFQHPQYGKIRDIKLDKGDFVFVLNDPYNAKPSERKHIIKSKLYINCYPEDAVLQFLNTDQAFHQGMEIEPGEYQIEATAYGFKTQKMWIVLDEDEEKYVEIRLIRSLPLEQKNKKRAWLGVAVQDLTSDIADYYDLNENNGVMVVQVFEGDPGEKAGIKPNDVITTINGKMVHNVSEFKSEIASSPIARGIKIGLLRNRNEKMITVYLAEHIDESNTDQIQTAQLNSSHSHAKKITNSIGMEFVYISPGKFLMGSPTSEPGRYKDETQHWVTLTKGFYMQTTEVTQGQWRVIMGKNPSSFKDCGDGCPVENVSWNDVQEFIRKLNLKEEGGRSIIYSLPTEAQWEYACRAGTTTPFFWGNCLSTDQGNYVGNYPLKGCAKGQYRKQTTPVASFAPNSWGLYDMHGNVWEWCQDWHENYHSNAVVDPNGQFSGLRARVMRGGSWYWRGRDSRSASRRGYPPQLSEKDMGFRLIRMP